MAKKTKSTQKVTRETSPWDEHYSFVDRTNKTIQQIREGTTSLNEVIANTPTRDFDKLYIMKWALYNLLCGNPKNRPLIQEIHDTLKNITRKEFVERKREIQEEKLRHDIMVLADDIEKEAFLLYESRKDGKRDMFLQEFEPGGEYEDYPVFGEQYKEAKDDDTKLQDIDRFLAEEILIDEGVNEYKADHQKAPRQKKQKNPRIKRLLHGLKSTKIRIPRRQQIKDRFWKKVDQINGLLDAMENAIESIGNKSQGKQQVDEWNNKFDDFEYLDDEDDDNKKNNQSG